jgi:membrane protease YdiL (CAAX protease family)
MVENTFWKQFKPLFGIGVLGLISTISVIQPLIKSGIAKMPEPPKLSLPALTALSLVQPTVLLAGAVTVGVKLAPKLGLRSRVAQQAVTGESLLPALKQEAPLAIGLGTAAALTVVGAETALRPFIGEQIKTMSQALPHNTVRMTVAGMLAGGIFEELLMRWGLMTGIAYAGWKLGQKQQGNPCPTVMWSANIVAALIFGAAHLPTTAALVPLTPLIVARALVFNSVFGIAAGWLFWHHSLEAAMISHATGHVVFTAVSVFTSFGH